MEFHRIKRSDIDPGIIYKALCTTYKGWDDFSKWEGDWKSPRKKEMRIKIERQEHNRFRFWGKIEELSGRILRVVTIDDKKTIHNAFPDRRFKP
jgi:hypothetical protein